MKLLLLLSDEAQTATQRDRALKETRAEAEETKKKVIALLNELFSDVDSPSAA